VTGDLKQDNPSKTISSPPGGRFLTLLISLVLLLAFYPFFGKEILGIRVLAILLTAILCTTVFALSRHRRIMWLAGLLFGAALVTTALSEATPTQELILADLVLGFLFFALSAATILHEVLAGERLTSDKIYGAICVYILIGLSWAHLYSLVELADPGSFRFPTEFPAGADLELLRDLRFQSLVYFSFVTLTTLGYGDITPVSTVARQLVLLEAMAGVFFIGVLVARLVGVHTQDKRSD
jgi:hypothetical protein